MNSFSPLQKNARQYLRESKKRLFFLLQQLPSDVRKKVRLVSLDFFPSRDRLAFSPLGDDRCGVTRMSAGDVEPEKLPYFCIDMVRERRRKINLKKVGNKPSTASSMPLAGQRKG